MKNEVVRKRLADRDDRGATRHRIRPAPREKNRTRQQPAGGHSGGEIGRRTDGRTRVLPAG